MNKIETVKVVSAPSVPVLGLLGVAFVVLKLCKVIGWSWWLVTLPFWIGPALVLALLSFILLCVGFVWLWAALVSLRGK